MALTINLNPEGDEMEKVGEFYISDRRLYLTADGANVVEEGSVEARTLYARPGTRIPVSAVEKFGIDVGEMTPPAPPETKEVPPAENKAAAPVKKAAPKKVTKKKAAKKKKR